MIISARVLLDYLAGRIDHKQFLDYSGLDEMADIVGDNPLHRCIERGELISDASFERGESERDDDWVTFVLKGPDPAISRFR